MENIQKLVSQKLFTKLLRISFILNKNSKCVSDPVNTKVITCV